MFVLFVTETTSQNSWIQIKHSAFNKCLALRDKSKLTLGYRRIAPVMTLDTCDRNSGRQLWQWTDDNQLKLKYNGACLTYDWSNSIHFQPCSASNQKQRWSCSGNKLKTSSNPSRFLVAFAYSGLPFGYNVNARLSCFGKRSCAWSRLGSGLTVCDNGIYGSIFLLR
jgi:hypothetical protein